VCVLGDVKHCEQAQAIGVDSRSVEDLKKLNKNKKLVKKLGERRCVDCSHTQRSSGTAAMQQRPLRSPAAPAVAATAATAGSSSSCTAGLRWWHSHGVLQRRV
jgi:hypothetical protein